jgi:hypothetical protein
LSRAGDFWLKRWEGVRYFMFISGGNAWKACAVHLYLAETLGRRALFIYIWRKRWEGVRC